VTLDGI